VIELDNTELVNGGWVGDEEYLGIYNSKYIVLTEGQSDVQIIQSAMRVLYPHLIEKYHFMDFGIANQSDGVGGLGKTVRAFIGSSIRNPIIAVFDNDTAGHEVMSSLKKLSLPSNIRLVSLPNLKMARSYPTFGPQGKRKININGRAASIEIYFGEDVLIQSDGTLTPVQWTGYNKVMKEYQGEILDKNKVYEKYRKKVENTEKDRNLLEKLDWSGMDAVCKAIFGAFRENHPHLEDEC